MPIKSNLSFLVNLIITINHMNVVAADVGEGRDRLRAECSLQSRRIRILHLLEVGWTGRLWSNTWTLIPKHCIGWKEGQVTELCQVNDIRVGGIPKVWMHTKQIVDGKFLFVLWQDLRLLQELQQRLSPGTSLEDSSLTICSGYDMVNINYTHVVCPDPQTAKVCQTFIAGT